MGTVSIGAESRVQVAPPPICPSAPQPFRGDAKPKKPPIPIAPILDRLAPDLATGRRAVTATRRSGDAREMSTTPATGRLTPGPRPGVPPRLTRAPPPCPGVNDGASMAPPRRPGVNAQAVPGKRSRYAAKSMMIEEEPARTNGNRSCDAAKRIRFPAKPKVTREKRTLRRAALIALLVLSHLETFKPRVPKNRGLHAPVHHAGVVAHLACECRDNAVHVMHCGDQALLVSRFPVVGFIAHHDAHAQCDRMVQQLHETAMAGHQVVIADDRRVLSLAG